MLRTQRLGLLMLIAVAPLCLARTPGAPLKPGLNFFSKQQDVQLGQEAAAQVRQKLKVTPDPMLQDFVNRIGQRLAGTPEATQSGFPFSFTVVTDPSVNAFALPGGPMFIHTGLLQSVDNEAQLAGVMAHEMSHVILRHGTNQASKANLIQLPAMLAGAVVGSGSMMGQLAQLGVGLGANSVLLHYSRNAESEADALGSHLMSEAGYNPIEMARFFEKLNSQGGSRGPQFLSDHPNPGNREQAIEQEIRVLPQRSYGFETGQFSVMKTRLGQVPRAAAASPNLAYGGGNQQANRPSNGWKQLRGQNFSVSYPDNWRAYGGENSDSVTIAPQDGLAQGNGSTQVGYGVILSYFFPDNNGTDLSANTNDLVHHLRSSNPNMQVSRNQNRVNVSGRPGLITMLQSESPFGGPETDALLTVETAEGLFYMIFIAPQNDFRNLQSTFDQMVRSVRISN